MSDLKTITNDLIHAIENGELEKVNHLLESFLLEESPEVQYDVSEMLLQFGFVEQGSRVLEHLHYLFPNEVQLAIDYASTLIDLEKEEEALDLLMTIDKNAPEYPQSLLLLADYYQMQGLFEVAEHYIELALEILPEEPLLRFAKAELLFEIGKFAEAARIYEQLRDEGARINANLSERLAEVYRAGGNYERALQFYMESLEDKVTADLLFGSAYCAFQCENYELAIKQLEDLKALDADYFSGYLLLAESYAMLEENERAYTIIKEGISRDEYEKTFYLFAGKLAIKLKKPDEAITLLEKAIALDPEYMEAILVLTSIEHQMENYDSIIDRFENLKQEQFEWIALYPFIADAYAKNEQYDRAYEIYKSAYNDLKEDETFLENYCYFLIEYGKRNEARKVVEQLIKLQPAEVHWLDLLDTLD